MSVLFSWIDYTLFMAMLLMSVFVGIYYGFFKTSTSAKEYLLGGKMMSVWPISMSLVSSCISGIPLLLFPTETYFYGVTMSLITIEAFLLMVVTYFIYLPVFYKLQVTSMYEYFQLRFDRKMRVFASVLYTINMVLYLPVVIYVPSLTLAHVTGIAAGVISPIVCGICVFYTTVGGFKAVVWTDAFQFIFMIGSMLVVVIIGVMDVNGIGNIWKIASEGGRLNINFDFDITLRDTFWSSTIGLFFMYLNAVSLNQGTVQKCMSLPSYKDMRRTMTFSAIMLTVLFFFVYFTGLAMYAKYVDCDPLTSRQISNIDEMLPYYVMDMSRYLPGLAGLFIAGIFSGALSTLSAGMNCLAATIYEDFVKPFVRRDIPEQNIGFYLKFIAAVVGVACTALVYVIELLGSLLPITVAVLSVAGGPIIGIFTVGMLLPMVNSLGTLIGGIVSLCVMTWIIVGARFYRIEHPYLRLPVSTTNCSRNVSITSAAEATFTNDDGFFLYRISHHYYSIMGFLIVVIVSIAISYFTKRKTKTVPRDCITPFMQFLLPKADIYHSVEESIKLTDDNCTS